MIYITVVIFVACAILHNAANADQYNHFHQVHQLRQGDANVAAVHKALEDLRQLVIAKDPRYPLDPMYIHSVGPITYDAVVVSVDITLTELQLEGLKQFQIQNVAVDIASHITTIKVSLPWIHLTGNYLFHGPSFITSEPATGSFQATLTNIVAELKIAYRPSQPGHVQLVQLTITITPGATQIKLFNFGGSETFNGMINDYLQAAAANNLQDELPTIVAEISKIASPILSKFLNEYNFGNIPLRSINGQF